MNHFHVHKLFSSQQKGRPSFYYWANNNSNIDLQFNCLNFDKSVDRRFSLQNMSKLSRMYVTFFSKRTSRVYQADIHLIRIAVPITQNGFKL